MPESKTDLEMVATADMVDELRRRSKVFFLCMRPLADDPEHGWSRAWGVDGSPDANPPEALARVLGLIEIVKFDLLYVKPTLDDIV